MTALPTIGVEEELAIVDRRTGRLAGRADEVLAELPDHLHGAVEHEMKRCQIELVSPVCTTLDEVATVLHGLRGAVARAAAGLDLAVAAGGTHPRGGWQHQEVTPKPAYRRLEEDYQRLADEQLVFGCHVHVCVDDPDRRIAALDRIRPWLATLLALTANSPFWEGEDTGYASYRYLVFSRWPTFGTPDPLGDWAGYEALVASLVESGAIDSASRLYWTARPS
ncbi:MAG TPA: YbdK family carboxylate-amine ligase, partial [Aquihabitans sp.]|nr:YbdK family carboxylate-amine ligase [Aquihabitans sp.]